MGRKTMKVFAVAGLLFLMGTADVFALSYQFDCNGDQVWDTVCDLPVIMNGAQVDIWLDDYSCPPSDQLYAVQLYFQYDPGIILIGGAIPNTIDYGGPFDPISSHFEEEEPGVYLLHVENISPVMVTDNKIKLGSIFIARRAEGETLITATNDIGGAYTDGSTLNCTLASIYPADATVMIPLGLPQTNYKFERMWPTLKQPWYFTSIEGVAPDTTGNIYVFDGEFHKFNPDGIFIAKVSPEEDIYRGLQPQGFAMDATGNFYVADRGNHRIQKYGSQGNFITMWGKDAGVNGESGTNDGEFNEPHEIAVDGNNNLYVADTGNNRIQKFTSDGTYITQWASEDPKGIAIWGDLAPEAVYVVSGANHSVNVYSPEGGPPYNTWGSDGVGDGQLNWPYDVDIDTDGNVYVSDQGNHRIQKFTLGGTFITKWGSIGTGDGQFQWPHGITVGKLGNIYVVDSGNYRIQKFDPDGSFISKWGPGNEDGYFIYPEGIALDGSSDLYVADTGNHRIQKFDSEGTFITKWGKNGGDGSWGDGEGEFQYPTDVAVDATGNMYVTDGNHRVQKFDSAGTFEREWGSPCDLWTGGGCEDPDGPGPLELGDGQFAETKLVAVNTEGDVYVSDDRNSRIQKFTSDGQFITKWGSFCDLETGDGCVDPDGDGPLELGDGQFSDWMQGMAIDGSGVIYVTDGNGRLQKFASNGTFLSKWERPISDDITIDSSGYVYTPIRGIEKYDSEGNLIAYSIHDYGTSPGQFLEDKKLAISPDGKIYTLDVRQSRVQILQEVVTPDNPKAIIVAGRWSAGDSLWVATQVCSNFAYRALTYQGYSKVDIYYLTADVYLDLDDNNVFDEVTGYSDDVDALPTGDNLRDAITQWAVDEEADSLVVYLNDHGGPDTFRISETETLTATQINSWLDDFQTETSAKVTVVYEACESGSFVDDLQGNDRIIITSTLPGEQAKFLSSGTISFSNFFWTHIFNGLSVGEAYLNATAVVNFAFSNQNPQLSGEAENFYIGNAVGNMIGEAPEIESVSVPQEITGEGTLATLTADNVVDPNGIVRVWAVIWPPDFDPGSVENPLLDIPTCELLPVGGDSYEGTYEAFDTDGLYQIAIYAMDGNNNTSLPQLTTVSRNYSITRKAIVIAGGSSTVSRDMIETNAGIAFDALLSQGYIYDQYDRLNDDIYFMSVDTFRPEVEGSPSNTNLQNYLTSLGTLDSDNLDLTLYLIGAGDTGIFTMNEDPSPDILLASDLDTWLDSLQAAKPGSVKVIFDGDKSGSFIFPLTLPPPPDERIIITSSGPDAPAYFSGEGDTCFSSFFWSQVASGATLYNALGYAKQAISFLSRQGEISFACYNPQSPLIDADGDGTPNEEDDYQIARGRTIGIGLRFADDPPQIGSASVEEELGVVTIVAENITTTSTLDRVWAVIKPIGYCPGYSGEETQEFEEVELLDPEPDGKYEGIYTDPIACYKVSVYAMDVDGNTSLPKETKIYQAAGGDIYEPDEIREDANVIVPSHPTPQPHTFHFAADEDWVKFYGINGEYYTILADNLEANCVPILELYFEDDPVPITVEYTILNNTVSIDFACLENGVYYVLLYNGTTGLETGYDLQVYYPYWPDPLVLIAGNVEEEGTTNDIDGAVITTTGGGSAISAGGEYEFWQKPGSWNMDAFASGYGPFSDSLFVGTGVEFIQQNIEMASDAPEDDDGDGEPNETDNCPYHHNPGQEDTVPPGGDGIGDECAGDKGDVNGGGMDVGDIQMIINIFLITHSPTGYEYWAADCNNDGKISVSDVQIAINKLLNP